MKVFVNLTSGLEILPLAKGEGEVHFLRIPSSWCEQHHWDLILQNLSDDLLMYLAIGEECVVYDCGSHTSTSRAQWQGIPFIRYVLERVWDLPVNTPHVRRMNTEHYFSQIYHNLESRTMRKLQYFTRFVSIQEIRLYSVGRKSSMDGDYEQFVHLVRNLAIPPPR